VPVRFAAPGEPVPGLPESVAGFLASTETFDSVLDTSGLARTFRVQLTPLDSAVRAMLARARG
jgi:hypothetical protein